MTPITAVGRTALGKLVGSVGCPLRDPGHWLLRTPEPGLYHLLLTPVPASHGYGEERIEFCLVLDECLAWSPCEAVPLLFPSALGPLRGTSSPGCMRPWTGGGTGRGR